MLGIFLDTETNGLNLFEHKAIEIAFDLIDLNSGEQLYTFESIISLSEQEWKKSDPESLKINGFTWKEVEQGKPPADVAAQIIQCFTHHGLKRGQAIFICQNPSFDRVFFSQIISPAIQEKLLFPYHWLDLASMFWALSIEKATHHHSSLPWELGYSKDKIAAFHHIPPEQKPHRALNGVRHLVACYTAVVGFPNNRLL